MYERYLPGEAAFSRAVEESQLPPRQQQNRPTAQPPPHSFDPRGLLSDPLGALEGVGGALSGALKKFNLGGLDTGDILLMAIILLIFLEGDDLELIIVLGLMILFGLNDKDDQPPTV